MIGMSARQRLECRGGLRQGQAPDHHARAPALADQVRVQFNEVYAKPVAIRLNNGSELTADAFVEQQVHVMVRTAKRKTLQTTWLTD